MSAVIVVQEEMLEQVLMRVLVKAGILKAADGSTELTMTSEATEVNTRKAKKLLAAKGYQVTGTPAFNRLIKEHGIEGKRRGKENWYNVEVLSRIPARV